MQKILGCEFKNKVKGAGLSIRQVCLEAGTSEASISQWCNGKRDILIDATYNKLVDAYNKLMETK